MRFLSLLILLSGFAAAQPNRNACTLSVDVEKEYRALPSMSDFSLSWEQRMEPRRALARKRPSDWLLQFLLQDPILREFTMGLEWDLAIKTYRSLEDHVLGELMEARLLSAFQRKRSREAIDRVLEQAPESPWAHLAALQWAGGAANKDPVLAEKEYGEVRRLCPQSLRPFPYIESLRNSNNLAREIQALRTLLTAKKQTGLAEDDYDLFRILWTWEGIAKINENAVSGDLEALRRRPSYDSMRWYSSIHFGYEQVLKNPEGMKDLKREILEKAPRSWSAYLLHDRAPEFAQERLDRFWGLPYARMDAYRILSMEQSKLTPDRLESIVELMLSMQEKYPDQGASWPPVPILMAEIYANRKVRLDRIPALVAQGLELIEYQEKYRRESDAFPKEFANGSTNNITAAQHRAREILIRHAIGTGQIDRAQTLLQDLRRELEQSKPADTSTPNSGEWRRSQDQYMRLAKDAGLPGMPVAEVLATHPENAERVPVARFEAKDLDGKTWTLAELKGKVVYLNVWTSWCGPCRAEMPGIQKLYEQWKGRNDRVVLTISADFHPTLAESFVKEGKFTFPVLYGKEVAEKFFPPVYFPQNWLIDPQGRRLDTQAPRAFETTLGQIEDLAKKLMPAGAK